MGFVEATRGYLEIAARGRPEAPHARQALERIERFSAMVHGATEEVDALCPGMQVELRRFVEMARKHCKELDPDGSSSSDEENGTREKKDKRTVQKERRRNRDAKYEDMKY